MHIDRIASLSLGGLVAEGITVRDPAGRTVLRARTLSLGLDPRALLGLKLRFTHGRLEEARVRAIPSAELALTLFEALSPPGASEPEDAGSAVDVAFEHVHLADSRLYGDVPGLENLEVVGLDLRGDIRIVRGELAVRVSALRGRLTRPFEHPIALDHGIFALDTAPLRMHAKLRASHDGDRVHLSLAYRAPELGDDRLDLLIALDPVSPALLADLGLVPRDLLRSPLRGHVRLTGPLREVALGAALTSEGGDLAVQGRLPEQGGISLRAASPGLALDRLVAYAPPLSLRASLELRAPPDGGPVALALRAPTLSMYGIELHDAEVEAVYARDRLTLERARLAYGGGHLDVSGWVDAEADLSLRVRARVPEIAREEAVAASGLGGALRTDVRIERSGEQLAVDGSIGIERFRFGDLRAKEMVLEGRISGPESLEGLRVDLRGSSWGTAYLGRAIGDVDFVARGKGPRYTADFALMDGRARTASAHLTLRETPTGFHVLLAPLEIGVPGREPWRARAELTLDERGVDIHHVLLAKGPERLELSGQYAYSSAYRVDATLQSFDLGGLRELSGLDLADLDGTVDGKLVLSGTPGRPRIDAQGSIRDGVFLGMEDLRLAASLVSTDGRFDLDAELTLPGDSRFSIYAGGEPGSGTSWVEQVSRGNYRFGLDFERVPIEVSRPWLGWLGLEPPPGRVSATVRGAGSLRAPMLSVKSRVEGLELASWPPLDLELELAHDGARAELSTFRVIDEHGELGRAQGFIEARLEELLDVAGLRASLDTRPLELVLSWEDRRLDALPAPMRVDLAVPTWGTLRIAQSASGPMVDLAARLGWPDANEGVEACGVHRRPHVELSLSARDARTTAKLTARLDDEQLAMADVEAETPIAGWLTGRTPLYLPRAGFTLNASTSASEEVPGLCEIIAGPLRLDVSALDAFADPPELELQLRSEALQLVAHPSQRARLGNLRDARAVGQPFELALTAGVRGPSFAFEAEIVEGPDARLALAGTFPRAALRPDDAPPDGWPPAELRLSAQRLELAPLLLALPLSVQASGLLRGDARLLYDFARARVSMSGTLALDAGQLLVGALGQELVDVEALLTLRDRSIVIEEISARDFDGRIGVRGELELPSLGELRSDLAITLRDFPLRRESAQVSRLTGSVRLRATTTRERTRAELAFGELRVNLPSDLGQGLQPLDPHPDIAVRGQEAPRAEDDPYLYELRMLAERPPLRVLRSDLSADVAADLTVRYLAPELTLSGTAEIKRGSFELFGKRFELGESRLAFDGGDQLDPLVSLHAVHRAGGDDIGVRVEGRLSEPQISFTHSDPSVTDTGAIIAQLLGARSEDPYARNRGATGAAAGILAGATAGLLTQEVRREFGGALPVLSLESSSETLRSARIRAGVQLDQLIERRLGALRNVVRGAYVEGFVSPGASDQVISPTAAPQSRGGGLLELRFPKDLVGTIEYRPVQNWRFDLAWEP